MNTAKERLLKIIDEIPEQEVDKILDFAEYLKVKREKSLSEDLTKASESSIDFWDNNIGLDLLQQLKAIINIDELTIHSNS